MLYSIALILIIGFIIGFIFEKIRIPKLVGMIIVGLFIGPYCLNLLDAKILNISSELRQIALVIILTRAGLSLDIASLKQIGRPALLMCFIPATFEIAGTAIFAPLFLGINIFEALLLGSVLAAVSPAVIVPRMIKLQEQGYGKDRKVPELLLVGSSADDVYVIVLFYSFISLAQNQIFDFKAVALIPLSIILGIILGIIFGLIIKYLFKRNAFNLATKILIILSCSFVMIVIEESLKEFISIASLLGIMTLGIVLNSKNKEEAKQIEVGYQQLWLFFEIFLFVLVGASVDLNHAWNYGMRAVFLILLVLCFRMIGVLLSLIKTKLSAKERIFCVFSYIPKATVQASIGGIALAMGLGVGNLVLTIAVLSILITAPLGAFLIDNTYKKLLQNH